MAIAIKALDDWDYISLTRKLTIKPQNLFWTLSRFWPFFPILFSAPNSLIKRTGALSGGRRERWPAGSHLWDFLPRGIVAAFFILIREQVTFEGNQTALGKRQEATFAKLTCSHSYSYYFFGYEYEFNWEQVTFEANQ